MPSPALASGGMTAITEWDSFYFVEGGNLKERNPNTGGWELHPYVAWVNHLGNAQKHVWWTLHQTPATYYLYSVFPVAGSPGYFTVRRCANYQGGGCYSINVRTGFTSYRYAGSGAEGLCNPPIEPRCPIGYVAARNNRLQFAGDPTWRSYCWVFKETAPPPVSGGPGPQVSNCTSPSDWTIQYK